MGFKRNQSDVWSAAYELGPKEYMLDPWQGNLYGPMLPSNQVVIGSGNGFSGFYCVFEFDKEGNFLEHSCGE